MRKNSRRGPSYLDVAEFILTGPFSPKLTLAPVPEPQPPENLTPLSRPLYIEIEGGGEPSPYLKELLSKVGNSEIEFLDFTLEGPGVSDEQEHQADEAGEFAEEEMSVIEEDEEEPSKQAQQEEKPSKYQYNPEEYIPNMHLLQLDPQALKLDYFNQALRSLQSATEQQRKEFILLYLTDNDLETYKEGPIEVLTRVAQENMANFGIVTRLERKAMVARYLQKKKEKDLEKEDQLRLQKESGRQQTQSQREICDP